eukprot:249734_1
MELQVYNAMLQEAGIDPYVFDQRKKRKYPVGERAFRHDILKGKTIWLNNKYSDFKLFITSYHPLYGLFTVCDHHPYTKRKRLITMLAMLCMGSFWAAISAMVQELYTNQDNLFIIILIRMVIGMINAIVLCIQELCMRHLLQCACKENNENKCLYCICAGLSRMGVCVWTFIAFIVLSSAISLVTNYNMFWGFLLIFVVQFCCFWTMQIAALYFKFWLGWRADMKMMEQLHESTDNLCNDTDNNVDANESEYSLSLSNETIMTIKNKMSVEQSEMNLIKIKIQNKPLIKCPYYITFEDYQKWLQRNTLNNNEHSQDAATMTDPLLSTQNTSISIMEMSLESQNGSKGINILLKVRQQISRIRNRF